MKTLAVDFSIVLMANYYIVKKFASTIDKKLFANRLFNSIGDILIKHPCSRVILCADSNSWRKDVCTEYKANRNSRNPELEKLFKYCIKKSPWEVLQYKGFEADDLLYLVSLINKCIIVTNDKDLYQLHDTNVEIYNYKQKKIINNIDADWILFEKICLGDSGDNISRCIIPGIGKIRLNKIFKESVVKKELYSNQILNAGIAISKEKVLLNEKLIELDMNHLIKHLKLCTIKKILNKIKMLKS